MQLNELLEVLPGAEVTGGTENIEVNGITDDSRETEPGFLFIAVKGAHTDGLRHVPKAEERGSVAVISEKKLNLRRAVGITVPDSMDALARVSAHFYGYPSEKMTLVGITGTNGKTTVSLLIQGILREAGMKPGLIGTLRYEIGDEILPAPNTTPNALRVQSLLSRMIGKGLEACVMEVSSHALALGRVLGCRYNIRVLTNLTRDHLDFHGTMESYYEAKQRLFHEAYAKPGGASVINMDDPWGRRLIRECSGPVWSFGMHQDADFRAMDPKCTIHGLCFRIRTPRGELAVNSPLIGAYNIYNILSAVAAGVSLGIPDPVILQGMARVSGVPGRFEKIQGPGFMAVVDYAHTDDALKRLLENARTLCNGRLITIFGCGGERDRGKRPMMGRAAAELSDRVIVTSDNPRGEDPAMIIRDILAGIMRSDVSVIEDRGLAIRQGIEEAGAGDLVVVAGKGHEDYQIIGDHRFHFDDREEVRKAIRQRVSKEKV
ncbi:MAG: UDP-N-acetylmuramoyl-L-alanyl-D-glutamate--2,6-diaminopimelate ligase [Nitrospirae bacterium CG_4_8_14_3_um_filter_50_41]|nr:MAG: UDP-N-acetylmuramoyl-L-alanyl-D-glutamate--2,6-diaminopimelate ligase [Nitrospirae bacterium CG_4_8_14_3_um_filter_50_41]